MVTLLNFFLETAKLFARAVKPFCTLANGNRDPNSFELRVATGCAELRALTGTDAALDFQTQR